MAKLEVSDDQLKKFMNEATAARVKEFEDEVKTLKNKLRVRERQVADWKAKFAEQGDAVSDIKQVLDIVHRYSDNLECE